MTLPLVGSAFYSKYGIYRSEVVNQTLTSRFVPLDYHQFYSTYKLLKWKGEYLLNSVVGGKITRDNVSYQVIYLYPRGKILTELQDQYWLSFREPVPELNQEPVVLIWKP